MKDSTQHLNITIAIINLRLIPIRFYGTESMISQKWKFLSIEMDPDESLKRSHKQIMTTYNINEISIDDRVILSREE
jgi:hypothetical protein